MHNSKSVPDRLLIPNRTVTDCPTMHRFSTHTQVPATYKRRNLRDWL